MQYVTTILWQIVTMFILVAVGYLMFRFKKISMEGSKTLGNVLIYLSLPCVIINGFLVERTAERIRGLLISALLAFIVLLLSTIISRLILRKNAIEIFSGAYANPGFFGVPLIVASLADGSVFYIASFIAFLNLFQWTYGVSLLQKGDEHGQLNAASCGQAAKKSAGKEILGMLKKLITAPFMIAIIIGCFFFFTEIPLPSVVTNCITLIGNLNTPIAMFTVGIYLAQTKVLAMFKKPRLYLVTAVRMVIIPLATLLLLCLVPAGMLEMKLAILIAAACPVGSNVAVYAQLYNSDYSYAVETVVLSTLVSIVTIPLIVAFATMLWM